MFDKLHTQDLSRITWPCFVLLRTNALSVHTGNFLHDFRSILLSHLVIVLQTKTKFSEELIFRIIFTHLHISIVMFVKNECNLSVQFSLLKVHIFWEGHKILHFLTSKCYFSYLEFFFRVIDNISYKFEIVIVSYNYFRKKHFLNSRQFRTYSFVCQFLKKL